MNESPNRQYSLVQELLIGYCLGTANIIPGVSGGTFLLVFKIYERVFAILSNINKANFNILVSKAFHTISTPGKASFLSLVDFLKEKDFLFLIKLMIGAVIAIVSLSSLIKYLILHHFTLTYALFFGLIFLSVKIPVKMLTHKKPWLLFFIAAGAVATVWLTAAVDPYKKTKMKSDFYEKLYDAGPSGDGNTAAPDKGAGKGRQIMAFSGKYSLDEYVYAGVCGAVSVSAMVLPGISGSLIMILMGQYFEVISAISDLKSLNLDALLFLSCFATGIIVGGLFFARLISFVLKRYYDATMGLLIGLMIGSLYALWPFKKSIVMARQYVQEDGMIKLVENTRIYTNVNILPDNIGQFMLSLVAFFCGSMIMLYFIRRENKP